MVLSSLPFFVGTNDVATASSWLKIKSLENPPTALKILKH